MATRALIIDDQQENRDLISYLLTQFGYSCVLAKDGEEGLHAVQQELPGLIFCDVYLPKIDGYELARRLKHHRLSVIRTIPLVAITALAMAGDREQVLAAGFDGYLVKPIVPETFLAYVKGIESGNARGLSSVQPPVQIPDTGTTILIVSDVPSSLELMQNTLESAAYRTVLASRTREALWLARQHHPDLILSDIRRSENDGHSFLLAVRADPALRDIPFVFLNAVVWGDACKELALGSTRFVVRSAGSPNILKEIRECLETRNTGIAAME